MTIESDIKNVQYFLDGAGDWTIEGDCVCEDICVVIGHADTEAEALTVKRAFEQVLLPRFTRDEAIALAKQEHAMRGTKGGGLADERARKIYDAAYTDAIRNLMRALAAAGVFVDHEADNVLHAAWLRDKLDAAGIK